MSMLKSAPKGDIPPVFVERERLVTALLAGLTAIGAMAFIAALVQEPALAWKSYVVNWNYFTSISIGGVMVAVVTWIVKAKWNWPLRRLHQSLGAFLPCALVLFLPMLFGLRENYFPWIEKMEYDPIVQEKAAYLNIPFLLSRNVVGVTGLFSLALGFIYLALRPDLGRLREKRAAQGPSQTWLWARLTEGWRGEELERRWAYRRMTRMAPLLVIVYALVMTIVAFDWAMSLEPHWFSTLFGGWFFMAAIWGGLAATAIGAVSLRWSRPDAARLIGPAQLWDLGKLTFAFCVFWTYLFWSQYLPIWYGKLPWEMAWLTTRTGEPWGALSASVIVLCFVVPFAGLLGVRPKKNPVLLAIFAGVVLTGLWIWHYMLIFPSLHHEGDPVFSWITPLIGLGFLGVFLLAVRWFLAMFPAIQLWQPPVDPEPLEAETGA